MECSSDSDSSLGSSSGSDSWVMDNVDGPITADNLLNGTITVRNLPWAVTSKQLRETFEQIGGVTNAIVVSKNERSQGWGIVTFHSPSDARDAMRRFNDVDMFGRPMRISMLESCASAITVSNLLPSVTSEMVQGTFEQIGSVDVAQVTSAARQAIVWFTTRESAADAVERFDGVKLADRPMFVRSFVRTMCLQQSGIPETNHVANIVTQTLNDGGTQKQQPAQKLTSDTSARTTKTDIQKPCVVCMDNEKTHLILPCGHYCVCAMCLEMIDNSCPICRGEASSSVKVYEA